MSWMALMSSNQQYQRKLNWTCYFSVECIRCVIFVGSKSLQDCAGVQCIAIRFVVIPAANITKW